MTVIKITVLHLVSGVTASRHGILKVAPSIPLQCLLPSLCALLIFMGPSTILILSNALGHRRSLNINSYPCPPSHCVLKDSICDYLYIILGRCHIWVTVNASPSDASSGSPIENSFKSFNGRTMRVHLCLCLDARRGMRFLPTPATITLA